MLAYDLVGFQTETDRLNFVAFCVRELGGEELAGDRVRVGGARSCALGAFRSASTRKASRASPSRRRRGEHEEMLRDIAKGRPLDRRRRPARLYQGASSSGCSASSGCWRTREEMRGGVNLLQIAPLSRAELETYADLRTELEATAGRINGRFATLDWTPIQIMTTGFTRTGARRHLPGRAGLPRHAACATA